jgi:hypothetical protein
MPSPHHSCGRYRDVPLTRRDLLRQAGTGFGAVAAAALLHRDAARAASAGVLPAVHHPARATSVIFLYMDGGVSQVDSFDPKPRLERDAGKPPHTLFKVDATQFNNVGTILPSPWAFRRSGQSGTPVSDLFPHMGSVVDDLAVIRSMTSEFPEHTNANYFLHTGSGLQGRPSMGAWMGYGLGSENADLPGFVVLNGKKLPCIGRDIVCPLVGGDTGVGHVRTLLKINANDKPRLITPPKTHPHPLSTHPPT